MCQGLTPASPGPRPGQGSGRQDRAASLSSWMGRGLSTEPGILARIPAPWLACHATPGQSPASSAPGILIEVGSPVRVDRASRTSCVQSLENHRMPYVFITALLRCNSHTIPLTHLKRIIPLFFIDSRTIPTINVRTFLLPERKPHTHFPLFPTSPQISPQPCSH